RALAADRRAFAGADRPALVLGGALVVLTVVVLAAGGGLLMERLLEPWPLARLARGAGLLQAGLSVRPLFRGGRCVPAGGADARRSRGGPRLARRGSRQPPDRAPLG